MQSEPNSWTRFLSALSFNRNNRRANHRRAYDRKLRIEQCEDRCMLAIFTVTDPGDGVVTGPGDQPGTLRQAVFDAEELDGADTIQFASNLNGATITLTQDELTITESVTIDASMLENGITIDADHESQIFLIANSSLTGTISLVGMTLTNGRSFYDGGAIYLERGSGSSLEATKLVLDSMTITGNYAGGGGASPRDAFSLPGLGVNTPIHRFGRTISGNLD